MRVGSDPSVLTMSIGHHQSSPGVHDRFSRGRLAAPRPFLGTATSVNRQRVASQTERRLRMRPERGDALQNHGGNRLPSDLR